MPSESTNTRRFEIALSYPGEYRAFVEQVAGHLASDFSKERVLYDKYHDEEFARLDLNTYLPALYRKESELIVIFLCPGYAAKLWCRLEWRHISQLIATVDAKRIMFLSFGNPGDLSDLGILSGDGYIDILLLSPQAVAEKILKRFRLNQGTTAPEVKLLPVLPALDSDASTKRMRRGRLALVVAAVLWSALFAWREVWPPPPVDPVALRSLLIDTCWVTYDPTGKQLDAKDRPVYPAVERIADDLEMIRRAGFDGILTSSSDGNMAIVPRLAKSSGLKVIMGIWNPADPQEIEKAIRAAENVDAYCVGDSQTQLGYPPSVLGRALWIVKKRTGRPAAVSDLAKRYESMDFCNLGDWIFPDSHLGLVKLGSLDPRDDAAAFVTMTEWAARNARLSGRLLVFKNVAYPHSGWPGASRENQALFYRELMERLHDPQQGHGGKTGIVVQGAFDTSWKKGRTFYPWDPFVGILIDGRQQTNHFSDFGNDGIVTRSLAADEILNWFRHRQSPEGVTR